MTKGIAKLQVSTELIESFICLPSGIRIIDAKFHYHPDALGSYFEFVISGDGLPTLDDTNGEIKMGEMVVHSRYVNEPYKSELKIDRTIVAFWRKED